MTTLKRFGIFVFSLSIVFSCSTEKSDQKVVKPEEAEQEAPRPEDSSSNNDHIEVKIKAPQLEAKTRRLATKDSLIYSQVMQLDSIYGSVPFYAEINEMVFFIVCSGKWNYNIERFGEGLRYGISDEKKELILPVAYDKIYNPDLTVKGYFEIRRRGKTGLFNYITGETLDPQFDFILPDEKGISEVGVGYKDMNWYRISDSGIELVAFDPTSTFNNISFDVNQVGSSMMYNTNQFTNENDPDMGLGVVIVPSYLDYFGLSRSEYYPDVILENQGRVDFGLEEAGLESKSSKTITDKLIGFIISFYESGIDARGYGLNENKMLVYNKELKTIDATHLTTESMYDQLCTGSGFKIVNDSIIEIETSKSLYSNEYESTLYDYATIYKYKKIDKSGKMTELESNRIFDFTKYIIIDPNYFRGCYVNNIRDAEYDGFNVEMTDHLSIHDLDIMRNEIFAEYGYQFKNEEWVNYFMATDWYVPLHEDVNDQLTDIDKANIKVILEMKDEMIGAEEEFLNRRKSTFYAAG